jgi:nucleoside diphosphate kinase/SAM-dependent methyltransferase
MAVERTLVLIKPDAMQRQLAGEILARFERRGLVVREAKLLTVDRGLAETHYAEHAEKPFYGELVEFITSGPTLALVLEGEGAIATVAGRWARPTRPTRSRARSAATSRCRCPTTWCTGPTRRSRPSVRSVSGLAESDYVAINREGWTQANAQYTSKQAEGAWAQKEITWGKWSIPERELDVLPDVQGKDVVELGCGTAYWGAWLKRAGAQRVVGVDVTPAQLETARQLNEQHGLGLEFVEANAEETGPARGVVRPRLLGVRRLYLVRSAKWIPEAARLLRDGGELVFMRGSTLQLLCMPDEGQVGPQLVRPQKGLYRLEWYDDDPGVEFHPPMSELLRILWDSGFELLDFRELFAPDDAPDHEYYDTVPAEWAKRWPDEEIWRLRLRRR